MGRQDRVNALVDGLDDAEREQMKSAVRKIAADSIKDHLVDDEPDSLR